MEHRLFVVNSIDINVLMVGLV